MDAKTTSKGRRSKLKDQSTCHVERMVGRLLLPLPHFAHFPLPPHHPDPANSLEQITLILINPTGTRFNDHEQELTIMNKN